MEYRGGGVPMDFEYDNGIGQRTADSPWPKADPNRPFGFASEPQKSPFRQNIQTNPSNIRLPQTPSKLPPTWREPDMGFSTDNQSSPEQADTEDTPEIPQRVAKELGKNVTLTRGKSPSKKSSSRRDSWMDSLPKMGNIFLFGPTVMSPEDRHNYALQRRARKRSRKEFDRDNLLYQRGEDLSDWDDERPSSREGGGSKSHDASSPPSAQSLGTIPAILSFLHSHPNLPHILGYYMNLLLNVGLIALFFWTLYITWGALAYEINSEVQLKASEILRQNQVCAKNYVDNKCGPDATTMPALIDSCSEWLDCMNRDAMAIGRASISAGTFATIINSFFENISWKAITTVVFIVFVCICVPKYLIGSLVHKMEPSSQGQYSQQQQYYPPPPQYMQSPYPPTPSHEPFFTPQHQRSYNALEHEMSPSKRERGRQSPMKQLGYR